MQIQVKADELQVDDIYKGRKIVMVDLSGISVAVVEFEVGKSKAFNKSAELLVERNVERIEQ